MLTLTPSLRRWHQAERLRPTKELGDFEGNPVRLKPGRWGYFILCDGTRATVIQLIGSYFLRGGSMRYYFMRRTGAGLSHVAACPASRTEACLVGERELGSPPRRYALLHGDSGFSDVSEFTMQRVTWRCLRLNASWLV